MWEEIGKALTSRYQALETANKCFHLTVNQNIKIKFACAANRVFVVHVLFNLDFSYLKGEVWRNKYRKELMFSLVTQLILRLLYNKFTPSLKKRDNIRPKWQTQKACMPIQNTFTLIINNCLLLICIASIETEVTLTSKHWEIPIHISLKKQTLTFSF